jgi:hypothetical protein
MTNHREDTEVLDLEPVAPRKRGRNAPPGTRLVEIAIDGVVLGTVDPNELTAGAQLDLEDVQRGKHLITWLVQHAGADATTVEAAIRPMPARALLDLMREISAALGEALDVPKTSARR